jgi:hypothetical protein
MVRVVQRIAARRQQFDRLPDAARLVDRALLADRQVHGQVQEGIGLAVVAFIDARDSGVAVCHVGVVLGMLLQPLAGQRLQRIHRLSARALGVNRTEKAPYIGLGWIEHGNLSVARDALQSGTLGRCRGPSRFGQARQWSTA